MKTTISSLAHRIFWILILLAAIGQAPVSAATFTVNSALDAVDAKRGDGVCETAPGNGVCTLRAAIQESNTLAGADVIVLPAGTYTISIPGTLSGGDTDGSLDIKDNLTILGAGADVTIVDGAALDSVFAVLANGKTINLSGLTIQNGLVSPFVLGGGGILARGNYQLTLTDVVIQNNHAGDGGGIYNQSNLTLIRSIVQGNTADQIANGSPVFRQGGGIYNTTTGVLTIRDSTIRDNIAVSGGGVFSMGTALVERSTISGNTATNATLNNGDGGGGIVNGAIVNGASMPGTISVVNSTISGNRANGHFGGVYNFNGTMTLSSVTIANNTADADGDGFGNGGGLGLGNGAAVTLRNTILASNSAAGSAKDCLSLNALALTSAGYNLIGNLGIETDCVFAAAAGDQIGSAGSPIDPGLKPLAAYGGPTFTHALADASAAIDAGDPQGCSDGTNALATDQRGAARVAAGSGGAARCDIGAYELSRPVANAGPDQRVNAAILVMLDGSASTPSGLTYAWTQLAGVPVALAAAGTASPSFTAPMVAGVLTFQLTVTDASGTSASDTVSVTVNAAPVADAGADQTVNAGATVALNGTASRDSDGMIVSYSWTQTGGAAVALSNAATATPSFVAPAAAGTLTFQLTVTDNDGATHSDSVDVNVVVPPPPPPPPAPAPPPTSGNKPPVANAGHDETVRPHSIVVLNGWGSRDPDGRIVRYRWIQTAGPRVRLFDASWPIAFFVAPKTEGPLTFLLTVTDNKGASSTDSVTITVDHCARHWHDRFFEWWDHHRRHDCR